MSTPHKPQLSFTNNHSGPPILSFSQTAAASTHSTPTKSPPACTPTASSYTGTTSPNNNNNNTHFDTHTHQHNNNVITVVPPLSHTTTKKRNSENVSSAHIPAATTSPKHKVTKSISNNDIAHISPPTKHLDIDVRPNLSPRHHRKKSSKIRKDFYFYGDLYSVRSKGKLQSKYKVKEKIGAGTFSTVRRGIRRSDKKEIAIKVISKTELNATEARLIKREIEILQQLEHPHIVVLNDIFESAHHLYLVLEYCECGELYDELVNGTLRGWFSERETAHMIAQLAHALQYMHERQIVHRDLKLENILIVKKTKNMQHSASAAAILDFPPSVSKSSPSLHDENDIVDTTDGDTDYASSDFNSGRAHTRNSTNNLLTELRSDLQQQKQQKRQRRRETSALEHDLDTDGSDSQSHMELKRRHSEYISGTMFRRPPLQRHPQVEYLLKISDFGLSKKLDEEEEKKASEDEQKQLPAPNENENENENVNKSISKTFGDGKLGLLYKRTLSGRNIFSTSKHKSDDSDSDDARRFMLGTNCGTLYYVAPEILHEEPYNEKVDTWSIGIICYVLLCGSFPFYSESEIELTDLILSGQFELGQTDLHWRKISEAAKDLIQKLLTADKVNRLSAAQILQHPFITGKPMNNLKRRPNKWNAGALFGKLPMKFKHMLDTAKMTFSETDSEYEREEAPNTATASPNMLNKFQFRLNLHSNSKKDVNTDPTAPSASSTNAKRKISLLL